MHNDWSEQIKLLNRNSTQTFFPLERSREGTTIEKYDKRKKEREREREEDHTLYLQNIRDHHRWYSWCKFIAPSYQQTLRPSAVIIMHHPRTLQCVFICSKDYLDCVAASELCVVIIESSLDSIIDGQSGPQQLLAHNTGWAENNCLFSNALTWQNGTSRPPCIYAWNKD